MSGLPILFSALAEENLDQIVNRVLRSLHGGRSGPGSSAKVSPQPVLDTAGLRWKPNRGLG